MPFLDVSDVLDDPDFVTTFDVMKATQSISSNGVATDTSEPIDTGVYGVVEAAASLTLQRLAEGSRQGGAIHIYTRYRLSDGRGNEEAHVVLWNGAHYTVVSVDDWSQFGAGYVRATCDLTDINVAA